MSANNLLQPTTAEIDAAEQAICGCLEENVDGYRRPMVEEMLERAKEARLGEFVRTHPADLDGNEDPLERDVRRMQAEPGRLRAVDTPRDHSIAAEHYSQQLAVAQMDRHVEADQRHDRAVRA
jgi:hypothetical protein